MSVLSRVKDSVLRSGAPYWLEPLLRLRLKNRLLVLCYHGVVSEQQKEEAYRFRNTVSIKEFRCQMEVVVRKFTPISPEDVLAWLAGKGDLPAFPILVTFDDGFRNNLTCAAPILREMGIPALVAVTTGYIGTRNMLWAQELNERILSWPWKRVPVPGSGEDEGMPDDPNERIHLADRMRRLCKMISNEEREAYLDRLRIHDLTVSSAIEEELFEFMTWDDVRSLHRQGISIGSHTVTHPILSRLTAQALSWELRESKATIERELQAACRWMIYPNGGQEDVSPAVYSACRDVGYEAGLLLCGTINSGDVHPFMLDRIPIPGHLPDYVFQSRISGLYSLLR